MNVETTYPAEKINPNITAGQMAHRVPYILQDTLGDYPDEEGNIIVRVGSYLIILNSKKEAFDFWNCARTFSSWIVKPVPPGTTITYTF